jgi:hypothetical protein
MNLDNIGKSAWNSVRNSVWEPAFNSVWDSGSDSVNYYVRDSVWDSVRGSLRSIYESRQHREIYLGLCQQAHRAISV